MKDLLHGGGWWWPPRATLVQHPTSHLFPSLTNTRLTTTTTISPPHPPPPRSIMTTSRATRKKDAPAAPPALYTPVPPSVAAERQLWPLFLSSLVLGGVQFIVGLEMHPLAPAHCLAWMLTMAAAGGLIGAMRSIEADQVTDIRTAPLTFLVVLIQGAYFGSACVLFAILGALWVWLAFCAGFMVLVTCIIGPIYWKAHRKRS